MRRCAQTRWDRRPAGQTARPAGRRSHQLLAIACVATLVGLAAAAGPPAKPAVNGEAQDFVFLTEARPLLVRVETQIHARPLQAAWDDFLKHLFAHLDINGDGVLSKDEAERIPSPEQVLSGSFAAFIGASATSKRDTIDADKDGKITLAELSAYYRKNGLAPFQFQLKPNDAAAMAQLAYLGGPRPDPEVDSVRRAIFSQIDADKDGKLTLAELTATPDVLQRLDENEDEIVTTQEMVPDAKPPSLLGASASMVANSLTAAAGNSTLVPIDVRGQAPAELTRRLHERYGKEKTLSRKALGLDEATFTQLDGNRDGMLDDAELAGFVKRTPDLSLTVRFADSDTKPPVELMPVEGRPSALAGKIAMHDGMLRLNLGAARAEVRRRGEDSSKGSGYLQRFQQDLLRPQLIAQFKQADANGDGYLDDKEVKKSRFFGGIFKAIDRDGDGKVSEKELFAYLDKAQDLQKRASEACVTLELRDQSRGLFDLLDTNRDNKLSQREMRQAPKLLKELDHQHNGYLVAKDLPRNYQLTLRRGSANAGQGQDAVIAKLYSGGEKEEEAPAHGPAWFRKMDRNRDGDVSRKEFLFSVEQFRKIDTDGDGLISVAEAEKAAAPLR